MVHEYIVFNIYWTAFLLNTWSKISSIIHNGFFNQIEILHHILCISVSCFEVPQEEIESRKIYQAKTYKKINLQQLTKFLASLTEIWSWNLLHYKFIPRNMKFFPDYRSGGEALLTFVTWSWCVLFFAGI